MLNCNQTSRISLVSNETDCRTVDSGVSMSTPGTSFSGPARDRVDQMPILSQRHSIVRRRNQGPPPPPPPYPGNHKTISTCSLPCQACALISHSKSRESSFSDSSVPCFSTKPHKLPNRTGVSSNLTNSGRMINNSSKTPNLVCEACGQTIASLGNACKAMGLIYHNTCFVCCVCNRTLRGRTYYSDRGRVYCEEDYRYCGFQHSAERCSGCDHIITETILTALGKSYHPGCFRCSVCQKCLDGERFTVDVNNAVYCVRDYHRVYAPKCARCKLPIMPISENDDVIRVVAMDRDFHIDCYKCESCGMQLTDEPERRCYPLQDGRSVRLLCRHCHPGRIGRAQPSPCTPLPRRTLLM